MIDIIFDACVALLLWGAGLFGISFEAINVWIFVVIWPLFTLGLMGVIFFQWRRLKKLSPRKNSNRNDKTRLVN